MIINVYWLNKTNLKVKFMFKYLRLFNYSMAYSETRIVIGGLAHVPVLIFIANFIKGKFGIKTKEAKDTAFKEEPVKTTEVKDNVVKDEKAETIKKLSNKLDSIEEKADEVYEKVKMKKKIKRRIKRNIN